MDETINSESNDIAKPLTKPVCSPYLICDSCGAYPLEPVHGHYVCPECKMPTKCCEGAPAE